MNGYKSAAALGDPGMWEEVNGENPPMLVDGDLIWRGAGRCENPVALAQAAVEEITRLTRERDEARQRATTAEARVREVEEALRGLLLSRDASWTGGHDWQDAVDRAAALLSSTTPTPAPTLTDAELRALREEGQRRRQRFEETLRRMQVADAQRGGGQ